MQVIGIIRLILGLIVKTSSMASGDSFAGSQASSVDDEELDIMDRSACPENTAKNNKWALQKLNDWIRKRNVNVDLKTVSGDDLAPTLSHPSHHARLAFVRCTRHKASLCRNKYL